MKVRIRFFEIRRDRKEDLLILDHCQGKSKPEVFDRIYVDGFSLSLSLPVTLVDFGGFSGESVTGKMIKDLSWFAFH